MKFIFETKSQSVFFRAICASVIGKHKNESRAVSEAALRKDRSKIANKSSQNAGTANRPLEKFNELNARKEKNTDF